jgi:hypothetical protein
MTTDIKPARVPRVSFTNIAPVAENAFTGSVTATIAETQEQIVFTFVTPELDERDSRAIVAGYANRLSIAASGKKEAADIAKALNSEVKTLNKGTYTIRGGASAQSSFSDTVISIALVRAFPEVTDSKFTEEQYQEVLANHALLNVVQGDWDVADEAGKIELVSKEVTKTKRLVSFYKL